MLSKRGGELPNHKRLWFVANSGSCVPSRMGSHEPRAISPWPWTRCWRPQAGPHVGEPKTPTGASGCRLEVRPCPPAPRWPRAARQWPRDWARPQAHTDSDSAPAPDSLRGLGPAAPVLCASRRFHLLNGRDTRVAGLIRRFREARIDLSLRSRGWCAENRCLGSCGPAGFSPAISVRAVHT